MPDTIWASIKTDWHYEAVCAGADDYLFFPKDESEARLDIVRDKFCDHCPVRAKCLNSALINNDSGFWGGTSTSERTALKKARHRATCPVCRSAGLVTVADEDTAYREPYQVCLSCGASWRTKAKLRLINDQPVEAQAG